jgi:Lrp/AsnC family leucine-responsive transcriptional regulator
VINLDTKDRSILALLQEDARLSHAAIARQVGLTQPAVYERIRRLEQRGLIRGYRAELDPEALGKPITAFISVTTTSVDSNDEAALAADPDILEIHHVAGEECYILKVRTESPRSLEDLLVRLRAVPGISKTKTTVVLSTRLERTSIALPEDTSRERAAG